MAKKEVVSITLEELTQHIASAIKENLIVHKGVVLNEGVRYDDNFDMFIFEIVDDIVTSGSTLSHLLNCLRSVNDTNNIVIFSLIGKKIQ